MAQQHVSRWRRFLRWTTRITLVLAAIGFAWFGWRLHVAGKQRAAIRAVIDSGGRVMRDRGMETIGERPFPPDDEYDRERMYAAIPSRWSLAWQPAYGVTFSAVTDEPEFGDREMDAVWDAVVMLQPRSFSLAGTTVSADSFGRASELGGLHALSLSGSTRIDDRAMPAIADLPGVRLLILDRTAVTDDGLRILADGKIVEGTILSRMDSFMLWLAETQITDEDLRSLSRFSPLRDLVLTGTAITDDGLAILAEGNPEICTLDITSTLVTDRGMEYLRSFKELTDLTMQNVDVTAEGMTPLKTLPNLKVVIVDYTLTPEEITRVNETLFEGRTVVRSRRTGDQLRGTFYPPRAERSGKDK